MGNQSGCVGSPRSEVFAGLEQPMMRTATVTGDTRKDQPALAKGQSAVVRVTCKHAPGAGCQGQAAEKANEPLKAVQNGKKGVLSLSWCHPALSEALCCYATQWSLGDTVTTTATPTYHFVIASMGSFACLSRSTIAASSLCIFVTCSCWLFAYDH